MRKKIRGVLSIVLALALVFAVAPLPGTVKAADPVKFKISSIDEGNTSATNLMFHVNMDFTTQSVAAWTNVSSTVTYLAGIDEASATPREWGAVYAIGSLLFFENLLGALPTETYVKIEKDTQFVWSGKTFALEEDLVMEKVSGTWQIKEALPQEFTITSIDAGNTNASNLMLNSDVNFGTHSVSDWTLVSSNVTYLAGADEASATPREWGAVYAIGSLVFFENLLGALPTETYVKIAKDTQFKWAGKTFVLAEDFELEKVGGAWQVKEEAVTVPTFELISIDAGNTNAVNLMLNSNVNFGTHSVSDWTLVSSNVTYLAGTDEASATPREWGAVYAIGSLVFFENLLGALPTETYVKIAKDTQFKWAGKTFALAEDFELEKVGGAWQVKEEAVAVPTFEITSIDAGNTNASNLMLNANVDFTSHSVAAWTLVSSNVTYLAGTNATDATPREWGAVYAIGSQVFFESLLGALPTETYVKIAKDTQFVWNGKTFSLAKDLMLVKESGAWVITDTEPLPAPPTKVKVTGIRDIYVFREAGNPLDGLTEMYLHTNTTWTPSNAPTNLTGQTVEVAGASENLVSIRPDADGVMVFNHFAGANMAEDTVVKIPAGVTFTLNGTTYEIEEDYVFTYDGGTGGTPGLPPDITEYSYEDVTLSDIYVQGGYDLYLTTGIPDSHKYNSLRFIKAGIQAVRADGTTEQIKTFIMHPDSGNLFMAFSYWTEEGNGIHIPKGSIGVNHEKQWGVRFTDDFGLVYKGGQWVIDNDAPVITFRDGILADGELYGLRLGMSEADMKALFAAEDALQGTREIEFGYPAEMFVGDALQAGTYDITVTARDNSGNVATYNIKVKGFTKAAPTIAFEGDSVREFDAGKKFDTASLKAKAKDANGKSLPVTFSYSEGAIDSKGNMKKGSHILYIETADDEGQPARRSVVLNCYEFTDIKATGIYYFINDDVFFSTNLKDKAALFEGVILTADRVLVNGKQNVIENVTVDQNSKSLHILCKKTDGTVVRIHEGTTFVNNEKYVGIRIGNNFQTHTDGIGWINDRIPRGGSLGNAGGSFGASSPQMGDSNSWYGYIFLCILAAGAVGAVCWKKRKDETYTE